MTLRPTCITALFSGLLLSACATTGPGSSFAGTASVAALQAGEWRVEDIAGARVIDNSPATLLFGADGRLSGNATCNRLTASYTVEGSKLTIGPVGTTRMACPPALMDQERTLVDLLGAVTRFSVDRAGTLTLTSASGKQIVARR
jgi:heat shock protein HslJ